MQASKSPITLPSAELPYSIGKSATTSEGVAAEEGKMLRSIALAAITSLLCACLPVTSKNPVGSTVGFKADPQLEGVWSSDDRKGEDKTYMVVLDNGDGSMTLILANGGTDWQTFLAKTSRLGGHTFLDAREILSGDKPADDELAGQIVPVLYRVQGGTLSFSLLDDAKTAAAIRSGAAPGAIEPYRGMTGTQEDVRLTADSISLDAFMQTPAGLALFASPAIQMKRVAGP